jgi:hypothetical protein
VYLWMGPSVFVAASFVIFFSFFFCGLMAPVLSSTRIEISPPNGSRAISSERPFYLLVWDRDWKAINDREGLTVLDASTTR